MLSVTDEVARESAATEVLPSGVKEDLTGRQFGQLTCLGFAGRKKTEHGTAFMWRCRCPCGDVRAYYQGNLVGGRSTGCINCRKGNYRHGRSQTAEYRIWAGMLQRCSNENDPGYRYYGGRGIYVCERWNDFENFFADMGLRPTTDHSIDRIDNEKGYTCGKCGECSEIGATANCRWATRKEQANNKSYGRKITHNGVTLCLSDWAAKIGISGERLRQRLENRTVEEALSGLPKKWPIAKAEKSPSTLRTGRSSWCEALPAEWFDGAIRRLDQGIDFDVDAAKLAGWIRIRAETEGKRATTRIIDGTILFKVDSAP